MNRHVASTHEGKKHKVTSSPIPQVDGTFDSEVIYTFVSDFHKEDIEYTLQEFLPEDVEPKFVSVVRIGGIHAFHQDAPRTSLGQQCQHLSWK